jgi:phosphoglycerol transferase
MKGRLGDLFFRALATEPMQRQVEIARRLCFSGVYVDRRGYADGGIAIEAQLQSILGKPPLFTSASKQQIFYDLTDDKHSVCTLPKDIQPGQLMERAGLVIDHQ